MTWTCETIPVVLVILDSTALVADRFFQSNSLRLLMSASRRGDLRVGISEVTLREAVNKVREAAQDALDKIASASATLGRLRLPTADFITELTADRVAEDYERFLREELDRHRVQIIEIPAISHEAVVARALLRQKPFDSKGHSGYRDALIWETIRDLANQSAEEVAFISANSRDFAQEPRIGAPLAQSLVDELEKPRRSSCGMTSPCSSTSMCGRRPTSSPSLAAGWTGTRTFVVPSSR